MRKDSAVNIWESISFIHQAALQMCQSHNLHESIVRTCHSIRPTPFHINISVEVLHYKINSSAWFRSWMHTDYTETSRLPPPCLYGCPPLQQFLLLVFSLKPLEIVNFHLFTDLYTDTCHLANCINLHFEVFADNSIYLIYLTQSSLQNTRAITMDVLLLTKMLSECMDYKWKVVTGVLNVINM